jgi:hypothetical protein
MYIGGLLKAFCLSLSVEKLLNIFHLAGESSFGGKIWVVFGTLNPLAKFGETAIPKAISFRQTASFEVSNVKIGRAVWSEGRQKK